MQHLRHRQDFLAAAKEQSLALPGFVIQVRQRQDEGPPRVGFTCSKKIGNAVARNRAKRRLRELVRLKLTTHAGAGHDYVLIGRMVTRKRKFQDLQKDMVAAINWLNARHLDSDTRMTGRKNRE